MIELWDFYLRLLAMGAALMLIAQLVAGDARTSMKVPLVGALVGGSAYLLNSSVTLLGEGPLDPFIDLFAISTPFWVWLFARRLFERDAEPRIIYAVAALIVAAWFIGSFVPFTGRAGFLILHFAALGLMADLLRVGLFERGDDLVEERRAIRLWLPLFAAAQTVAIMVYELYELFAGLSRNIPIIEFTVALIMFLIILFAGLALLRTVGELLGERPNDAETEQPETLDLTPQEKVLHERLEAAMADGIYREPGLTIAALAERLDTPEHRLRALINRRLGHRNFSAYLNRYRITEAREKLSRAEDVDLPVLTIAMDLGYNSLPTFNRAFRTETGTTPSEFRRLSFNDDGVNSSETAVQN
ncbi:helix-turn-helix domain-containing protein [Erythrobacter rubeus]|uniref:Helix-turn-helix transcriptional regulator n=1 Tax=Erythrobacter rubeus TaxID=2760803 RepID=A0ABR8KQR3_9SPHN|nr:helix-turn-helix domain-containing protein [Erythrobacter rubeus]MBD2842264.1 helix-turn-helix transcriptional regulator [Erythrobacter rubeus]